MAFPSVVAAPTTSTGSGSGANSVTLPGTTSAGEILLLIIATDGDNTFSYNNFTSLSIDTDDGKDIAISAAYKVATGSDGASETVTLGSNEKWVAQVYRISGGAAPDGTGGATGGSGQPNPPSHTAGGGSADNLWIACGALDNAEAITGAPTNYINLEADTNSNPGGVTVATAERDNATATEDPGAFSGGGSDQWAALTIAVPPGSTDRTAIVTAFELEVPTAPRTAIVTAFEFETEDAARTAIVTAYELETEDAARQAQVTAFEFETPDAPRTAQVTAFELETEDAARTAQITAFELESPDAPAFKLAASTHITAGGENTTAQLTAPSGKTTGDFGGGRIQDDENPGDTVDLGADEYREDEWSIYATNSAEDGATYQFRVLLEGTAPTVSTVDPRWTVGAGANRKAVVTAFELEVPTAPRTAIVSAFELETEDAARTAVVSAFELETEVAGRTAQVTAFEFETEDPPRTAIVTAFELETGDSGHRAAQVTAFEFEIGNAGRTAVVTAYELQVTDAGRTAVITAFEFETGDGARQAQITAFEFETGDSGHRTAQVTAFELETGDAGRTAQVTAYELEVPTAPRTAIVTAFEFETPDVADVDRAAQVTAFEFEVPTAPRTAIVTAFELQTEDAPRAAQITAFELETGNAGRQAQVTAFEFETADAPRTAIVTAFEFEVPDFERAAQVTAFELETGDAGRTAIVSAFEFETGNAGRQAQVTAFELETGDAGRTAIVSAFEFETADAPRAAQVTAFEFEVPATDRTAIVTAFELETGNAGRQAVVTAFEFEAPDTNRRAIVTAFEFETGNAARQAVVTAFELETPEFDRKAIVTAFELRVPDTIWDIMEDLEGDMSIKVISRLADTNGDGTGTWNAIGDYDGNPTIFKFTAQPREHILLSRLIGSLQASALTNADVYGTAGGGPLTNGIQIYVTDIDGNILYYITDPRLPVKTNAAWAHYCYDFNQWAGLGTGKDHGAWRWTFVKSGQPVELLPGWSLNILMEDDFSGKVDEHHYIIQGYNIFPRLSGEYA